MFPRTKAALRRLKAAWLDLTAAKLEYRVVRSYSNMTPEQRKAFDEAFEHMDRAFAALRKADGGTGE